MFLLDTNVVSEMRRPRADPAVRTWVESEARETQFLSVISITEMARGASRHPDPVQQRELQNWLDASLELWFEGRLIELTPEIARLAGEFAGMRERMGRPLGLADALLGATAAKRRLVFVTRNTKDFLSLPIDVYDPWTSRLTRAGQQ